jgi:hypothetical protein
MRYFGVNSDEGFSLWIDGQLVGEYADGRGPATTDVSRNRTDGTMTFNFPAAGSYFMVLDYFENSGGEEIEFFQTNSVGGDPRLINVDAELVVFRDNATRIDATNIVVADANTITFEVDLDGAEPGTWNAIVTPQCGETARCYLDKAVQVVSPPVGTVDWTVSPADPVDSSGAEGGPFAPNQHDFVIFNTGTATLNWSVSKGAAVDWLDLPGPPFGTLDAGGGAPVTVILNAAAATVAPGAHTCPLVFSIGCNPTGPSAFERDVRLTVFCPCDFNRDSQVNFFDWAELAGNWSQPCSEPDWCAGTDLDHSGHVDIGDPAVFAQEWLLATP